MGIFRNGLAKTRQSFFGRISQMLGNSDINDETWDDVEALLIQADMGVPTTQRVLSELQAKVKREGIDSGDIEPPSSASIGRALPEPESDIIVLHSATPSIRDTKLPRVERSEAILAC